MKLSTIQISEKLKKKLAKRKIYARETYEEIIWQLIEESEDLSTSMKKEIQQAEKEIAEGQTHTLDQVKEQLGMWAINSSFLIALSSF